MKKSRSPIWEKKRQRKFTNTKKAKIAVAPVSKPLPLSLNPPVMPKKEGEVTKQSAVLEWVRRHDSDIQLVLFPFILLVILIILAVFTHNIFLTVAKQAPIVDEQISLEPYPYVQGVVEPDISAKAAIILDRGSQVILFSKNPQLRFSMASTTKIMTAMTALDYYKPDDLLTVKTAGVPGSGLNLYPGEQFHFIDLMYAMLLPSANDAAQAIADNYPGGSGAFVKKMNEKAQSLHLINTHYADPIGLDDDGDYSTVIDMARLASYAIANPTFVAVTSTKYKIIYDSNYAQYSLTNLNKLLGIDGVTGIKTGTTEGAGEVLVTSTVKNGKTYLIVVMDSTDRFYDTSLLLHFIDTNVKYILPQLPH